MKPAHYLLAFMALMSSCAAWAQQDVIELKSISIVGNPELPKTIYLVPWKKAQLGDLTGKPQSSLLDENLTPVDPTVFRRELNYYDAGYAIQ